MIKITKIISVTNENELNILDEVASALKKGEVVAIPTETVYGLGANALFSKSAQKIFTVKGRPSDNPLIVHIAKEEDAKEVGKDIPEIFYTLSKNFWPGPLTMIVKKNDKIPYSVTGGLDTVGIRIPDNIYTRYLIEKAGCPVAAPSANISGTVSATSSQYVYDDFKGKIPYIVDNGNCEIGLESTVINLTVTPNMILRPGKITIDEIRKFIPDVIYHPSLIKNVSDIKNPASPGMKYKHYSPSCPVVLVRGNSKDIQEYILKNIKETECAFSFSSYNKLKELFPNFCLGDEDNLSECGEKIFKYLREADKQKVSKIYIPSVKEEGIGVAIMNRLKKTCGGNIVDIKNVLFICTGNTCRSPMAEFILKSYNLDGVFVKSRGLYVCCMSNMAFSSEKTLKDNDIPFGDFKASQVSEEDIVRADIIYTMTNSQRDVLVKAFPHFEEKIKTLKENGDILDPYMQPIKVYQSVFDEIRFAIEKRFLYEN
ncbi:MAG: threonylcarbamoyl-AMP synthase [Ruminococcaceae bacterium]|nr:threonylcarbamoyl-AMP synthase [Oscillospiraceae bacterium]